MNNLFPATHLRSMKRPTSAKTTNGHTRQIMRLLAVIICCAVVFNITIFELEIRKDVLSAGLEIPKDEIAELEIPKDELAELLEIRKDEIADLEIRKDEPISIIPSQRQLEFIHIPKTGGSSIEQAASDANITWGVAHWQIGPLITGPGAERPPDWKHFYDNNIFGQMEPWHTPPRRYFRPYEGKALFSVVRNPYSKFMSDFYCPYGGYEGHLKEMNQTQRVAVLNQVLSWRASKLTNTSSHSLLQSEFVYNLETGQKLVDHVLKFENLARDFPVLMQKYSLPIHLQHNNVSGDQECMSIADLYPETIKTMNEFLRQDFENFGYAMIDPETWMRDKWANRERIVLKGKPPKRLSELMIRKDEPISIIPSKRQLEFVHIPKTGGSSIEQAASDANITWGVSHWQIGPLITGPGAERPDWKHFLEGNNFAGMEPWHTPPARYFRPYEGKALFSVVRNPYTKFLSDFYCRWGGYRGPLNEMNQTQRVAVLNQALSWRASKMTKTSSHSLLQSEFVYNLETGQKLVDHVLKFENLARDFPVLMQKYGLPIHLKHINKGAAGQERMSIVDLYPETIKTMNEFLRQDFENFGYAMIDPEAWMREKWANRERIVLKGRPASRLPTWTADDVRRSFEAIV